MRDRRRSKVAPRKRQDAELEVGDMKMSRLSLKEGNGEWTGSERSSLEGHVRCLRDKAREAGRRSFGYLVRMYQRDAPEEEQRGDAHTS